MKIIRFLDEKAIVRHGVPMARDKTVLLKENPFTSLEKSGQLVNPVIVEPV